MRRRKYVAYYRVSTEWQGRSGLGLEAQQEAVRGFTKGGEIVAEVIEVESGKRNDRPKLAEALRLCRLHKAMLVIAKLDRLARNVNFVSSLMESGAEFVTVDFPQANRLTVHVMAAVAEHEAAMISARTKAALAAAKARLLGQRCRRRALAGYCGRFRKRQALGLRRPAVAFLRPFSFSSPNKSPHSTTSSARATSIGGSSRSDSFCGL